MKRAIVITVIELVALVGWLAMGGFGVGPALFLLAGLIGEHVVSSRLRGGLGKVVALSGSEAIIWVLWLAIAGVNPVAAAIFLFATMFVQHNVELSSFSETPIKGFLFNRRSLDITALETVGGAVWLALVQAGRPVIGAIVLAGTLLFEHISQGKKLGVLSNHG